MAKLMCVAAVLACLLPLLAGAQKFSAEESQYIRKLAESGGLQAVCLSTGQGLVGPGDGRGTGFHGELFWAFTQWLGVKGNIRLAKAEEAFGTGSEIPEAVYTNPAYSYTPKVFESADLIVGSLTPIPWRARIMTLVPVIPNAVVLLARKDAGVRSLADIGGKRVVVPKGSSFEAILDTLVKERGLKVTVVPSTLNEPYLTGLTNNKGDVSLGDALNVFATARQLQGINILEPVSDIHYASWGMKKGNTLLDGLLTRFLRESSTNGLANRLVQQALGASTDDYFELIGFARGQEVYNLLLSTEERLYLEEMRSRGELRVAARVGPDAYAPQADGAVKGFDYHLALGLARTLGLKLVMVPVKEPGDFYARNGVFDMAVATDPAKTYVPDLFSKVDLYASPLAMVAWRQKLSLMIPVHPFASVIAGKNADRIRTYKDLEGKRIAVLGGTYIEKTVQDLMAQEKFSMTMVYYTGNTDPLDLIMQGKADVVMDGAMFFAQGAKKMREGKLTVSPIKLGAGTVAWAVAPDNRLLASIIRKYMDMSQGDGSFGRMFQEQKGIDFNYYLGLINP